MVVGCSSGLRESKIVNLLESQCDFVSGRINISGNEMKNEDPLSIKMTAEVKSTLLRVISQKKFKKSSYVFLDESGKPYTRQAVSIAFHRACARAGIKDLRFHDLRHDFATVILNNGGTLIQVQHALGQRDPRMASRYAHLLPENRSVAKFVEGRGTATILLQSEEIEKGSFSITP